MPERTAEDVRAYLIGILQRAIVALRAGEVEQAIDKIDGWRENAYKLPLNVGPEPAPSVAEISFQRLWWQRWRESLASAIHQSKPEYRAAMERDARGADLMLLALDALDRERELVRLEREHHEAIERLNRVVEQRQDEAEFTHAREESSESLLALLRAIGAAGKAHRTEPASAGQAEARMTMIRARDDDWIRELRAHVPGLELADDAAPAAAARALAARITCDEAELDRMVDEACGVIHAKKPSSDDLPPGVSTL